MTHLVCVDFVFYLILVKFRFTLQISSVFHFNIVLDDKGLRAGETRSF